LKCNEVEEAISGTSNANRQQLPSELRARIKRLLELDPSMGRQIRSKDAEEANFAGESRLQFREVIAVLAGADCFHVCSRHPFR
jgi:hypothetical protein